MGQCQNVQLLGINNADHCFAVIGATNPEGLNANYWGLLIAIEAVLWVILEEYGWRGYLFDELADIKPIYKYLIIGVLWYAWHLWFLNYASYPDLSSFILTQLRQLLLIFFWDAGHRLCCRSYSFCRRSRLYPSDI